MLGDLNIFKCLKATNRDLQLLTIEWSHEEESAMVLW